METLWVLLLSLLPHSPELGCMAQGVLKLKTLSPLSQCCGASVHNQAGLIIFVP